MIETIGLPKVIEANNFADSSPVALAGYILNNYQQIISQLNVHGAVLFRGFDIASLSDFEHIVSKLPLSNSPYVGGDSPRTKLSSKVYTSTEYPADQPIALHNELSFSNKYPSYLIFYCELPSVVGGETPLLDNRDLFKKLPTSLIENYKQKKLKYVMNLHSGYGIGKSWQDVFETDDKLKVEAILNRRQASFQWDNGNLKVIEVVQPIISHPQTNEMLFFSQAHQWHPSNLDQESYEILVEIMPEEDFYHYVCHENNEPLDVDELNLTREIMKEIQIVNPWQKGDFLIVDNLLVMHGRNPFQGERKIRLSLCN